MPSPTVLRFVSPTMGSAYGQAVYWKARWLDPWERIDDMWAAETTWACAPSVSTASLTFRYGDALKRGQSAFEIIFRVRNHLRFFVRIDHTVGKINPDDTSPTVKRWYGVLDTELDELQGPLSRERFGDDETTFARGSNHFLAYGLESLLGQVEGRRSFLAADEEPLEVARALTMNERIRGHEGPTLQKRRQLWRPNKAPGETLFHNARTGGEHWSTKDAIEYLLARDTPRDHNDEAMVPWALNDRDDVVPTWDAPELVRQGRTTRELLNTLLARQRLLSYRVFPTETTDGETGAITNDKVQLIPFAFNGADLALDSLGVTLPANPRQVILALEKDRGARPVLRRDSGDDFDQVVVRGARRTSAATFSFIDGTLDKGWNASQETAYEQGGSLDGAYADADEGEREIMNEIARGTDRLRAVFARFVLIDPWRGAVGNGTAATRDKQLMAGESIAPEDERFLQELPLLEGMEYSDALIGDESVFETASGPHLPLKPIVIFPRAVPEGEDKPAAEARKYRHAEKSPLLGQDEEALSLGDDWTAHVRVDHLDGSLWVELASDPQHFLAASDFTPLEDAGELELTAADFREMLATLGVAWSAYAEGKYPADADLPVGTDAVRQITLEAGNDYRADYIVPGTVVAIDAGGGLIRTTSGGYVADDRDELAAIAKLAWQWYGQTRHALTLETSLTNAALEIGDYVASLGDPDIEGDIHIDDVGTVVTSIRLMTPLVAGSGPLAVPFPELTYETAFGELDVLALRPG